MSITGRSVSTRIFELIRLTPVEWAVIAAILALLTGLFWPKYNAWQIRQTARREMEAVAMIRSGIDTWSAIHSTEEGNIYPAALDSCRPGLKPCRLFGTILKKNPPGVWQKVGINLYRNKDGKNFDYNPYTGVWTMLSDSLQDGSEWAK